MNFSSSKQIFLRFYAYMYLYTGGVVKKGIKHFPDSTGRSRGRAQGPPPPLFLDQNEAKRAEKYFWRPPPPPNPPPYLEVWIRQWIVSATYDCITLQLSLLASYIFTDCILIIKFILL